MLVFKGPVIAEEGRVAASVEPVKKEQMNNMKMLKSFILIEGFDCLVLLDVQGEVTM